MRLFAKPNIDFIGARKLWYSISLFVVLGTAALGATRGINYGIEFTGGTLVQVVFAAPVALDDARQAVSKAGIRADVQSVPEENGLILRSKGAEEAVAESAERIERALREAFPGNAMTLKQREFIGPVIGAHLLKRTWFAVLFSLAGIVIYVAFRFSNPLWGLCGVLALAHDVVGTLGLFLVTGKEVDLLVVAALLTIAGFSINDTIVIFDRMREKMRILRKEPMDVIVNQSVNETLSRTVITSGTVFLTVLVLCLFGGEVIHNFALALVVGVVLGTYSTLGVAAPLIYEWDRGGRRK